MHKIGKVVNKYGPHLDTMWYCMEKRDGNFVHCYYISTDELEYADCGSVFYSTTYISVVEAIKIMIG